VQSVGGAKPAVLHAMDKGQRVELNLERLNALIATA